MLKKRFTWIDIVAMFIGMNVGYYTNAHYFHKSYNYYIRSQYPTWYSVVVPRSVNPTPTEIEAFSKICEKDDNCLEVLKAPPSLGY